MNRIAAIFILLALAVASVACGGPSNTEILQLGDFDPRQLDVGDRVRISAQDLPVAGDIRRVTVTLRGTLARPGRAACNAPVELTVSDPPEGATTIDRVTGQLRDLTYAESTRRTIQLDGATGLEFLVNDAMLEQLMHCPGSRASGFDVAHATLSLGGGSLRGGSQGVTVRIEGLTGAHAVTGTIRGPVLDLFAPATARLELESATVLAAATHTLDTLGITPAEGWPADGGLHIAQVRAGSAAERAGLLPNDVIRRVDGLNILALADFRTAPGGRRATLSVLRGDLQDERVIALEGLSPTAPIDLYAAGVALCVALALLAAFLLPRPALWVWFTRQLARARRIGSGPNEAAEPFTRVLIRARGRVLRPSEAWGSDSPMEFVMPWLLTGTVVTCVIAAPLAEVTARLDPDLSVLFAASVLLQRSGGVFLGIGTDRDRTMGEKIRAAVRAGWVVLPAILALASAVAIAGGLSAQSVLASQGGAPWQWLAFRIPATVPLAAMFLLAQCGSLGDDTVGRTVVARTAWRAGVISEWIGVVIGCALFAWCFLGGWALPGVTLAEQQASVPLQMTGAVLFAIKTWGAVAAVCWIRLRTARVGVFTWMVRAWRSLGVATGVFVAMAVAWALVSSRLPWRLQWAVSMVTFASFAGFSLLTSLRWRFRRAPAMRSYLPTPFRA